MTFYVISIQPRGRVRQPWATFARVGAGVATWALAFIVWCIDRGVSTGK